MREYNGTPYSDFTCIIPDGGVLTTSYVLVDGRGSDATKYDATEWTVGMPTDAGEYIAKFVLDEAPNFTGAVVTQEFEILPRDIVANVKVADKTYNGEREKVSSH